jgi:hypothetical protein
LEAQAIQAKPAVQEAPEALDKQAAPEAQDQLAKPVIRVKQEALEAQEVLETLAVVEKDLQTLLMDQEIHYIKPRCMVEKFFQ